MCLVLLVYRAHPDASLILAGNRDEFVGRPTAPPALIGTAPRIHAGRDLEAGGTWMGRNEHGVMAALTNRRGDSTRRQARSRGEIVRTLLEQPDAEASARALAGLDVEAYRPFNVLFGSPERFYYASSAAGARPRELASGYYALSNSDLDDASWPKVARSLRLLRSARHLDGESLLLALQAFLCDPTPPDSLPPSGPGDEAHGALGAVFIHTEIYGTVSATLLTADGRLGDRYYYAEAEAMRTAQNGWAQSAFGNGPVPVPPSSEGSPFRLLTFDA
jgi:uncharacterized protein with NRDE domain